MNLINVGKHLEYLGLPVRDKVTQFNGVVTSVTFDLYGCIQCLVNPGCDKDGVLRESAWFDLNRLAILDTTPVMDRPNYETGRVAEAGKGPEAKPLQTKP